MPVLLPSGFRPGPARTTVRIPVGERGGVAAWRASDGAVSSLYMPKQGERGSGQEWLRGEPDAKEVDERLEDLDSLRQSLLGVEEAQEEGDIESKWDTKGHEER